MKEWQPTPVFLPGEPQGQSSMVGCSPKSRKEFNTTETTQHMQYKESQFLNQESWSLNHWTAREVSKSFTGNISQRKKQTNKQNSNLFMRPLCGIWLLPLLKFPKCHGLYSAIKLGIRINVNTQRSLTLFRMMDFKLSLSLSLQHSNLPSESM